MDLIRRRFFSAVAAVYVFVAFAWSGAAGADVSTVELSTGEKLKGEVVSRGRESLKIKTAYATVELPYSIIESETITSNVEAPALPSAPSSAAGKSNFGNMEGAAEGSAYVHKMKSSIKDSQKYMDKVISSWDDDYRAFIEEWMPEYWSARLNIGIALTQTTTITNRYSFSGYIKREWENSAFTLSGFYEYVWENNMVNYARATTDKYGGSANYEWGFLGPESNWFIEDSPSYRYDGIKGIDMQIDNYVAPGYKYDIEDLGIKTRISTGPSGRYLEANGYDRHWIPMWGLKQSITWDITELLRFEQTGYYGMDLERGDEGTVYFMMGIILAPKAVASLALRFTNDYDSVNSSTALKNETRLTLSVEVPLEGSGVRK